MKKVGKLHHLFKVFFLFKKVIQLNNRKKNIAMKVLGSNSHYPSNFASSLLDHLLSVHGQKSDQIKVVRLCYIVVHEAKHDT